MQRNRMNISSIVTIWGNKCLESVSSVHVSCIELRIANISNEHSNKVHFIVL